MLADIHTHTHAHTHPGGVRSLGVIFQHSGHAKVGHFAHQVAVYQDVARRQVTVNIAHVWQILHARCNPTQDANQLDYSEATIIFLQKNKTKLLLYHFTF